MALVVAERQRFSLICKRLRIARSVAAGNLFLVLWWRCLQQRHLVEHDVEEGDGDNETHDRCGELSDEELEQIHSRSGGDESVLRVAEDGCGTADVGRCGDAKADGQQLSPVSSLLFELEQNERCYDQTGGIVGDECRHESGQKTDAPENAPQRSASSTQDFERHESQESFSIVVIGQHHHTHEEKDRLHVSNLGLNVVYFHLADCVEDHHESCSHQSGGWPTERKPFHVEHDERPYHHEDDGSHDLDVERRVLFIALARFSEVESQVVRGVVIIGCAPTVMRQNIASPQIIFVRVYFASCAATYLVSICISLSGLGAMVDPSLPR